MNYDFAPDGKRMQFIDRLKTILQSTLPGVDAHLRLAPGLRVNDLKAGKPLVNPLESAVLILLYPVAGQLFTVVILRNEYKGAHSGQISLPGGKTEETDSDFIHTALREANEEIGIHAGSVQILGQLSRFYVRPSNYIVYPVVGYTAERPVFVPDPTEVQKVIEIDIFKEISYQKIVNREFTFAGNYKIEAPGFVLGDDFMWGATAMIFSELIQILENAAVECGSVVEK